MSLLSLSQFKIKTASFIWIFLVFSFSLSAYFTDPSVLVDASYLYGNGIGYNKGYGSIRSLFTAPNEYGYPLVPFFDARAHYTDNDHWAANIGLGGRFLLSRSVLGVNVFYDFRSTSRYNYNQVGLGVEWMRNWFSCRFNGYFPTGSTRSKPFDRHRWKQKREIAMNGVDMELGANFNSFLKGEWYVGLGPYFYKGEKTKKAYGGQAKIKSQFGRFVCIEGAGSYDSLFKARGHISIALTLPLGYSKCVQSYNCRDNYQIFEPVNRAEIIVLDKHTQEGKRKKR